jgi:transketolase
MRRALAAALEQIAAADRRVVVLTGDLGYTVLDGFAARFPDRFFNAGVAEQGMIGIATGLAEAGFLPFVYSIGTFAVLRPYEFIRNGPVQHQLPVRIVGIGCGFDYGLNGASHYALEDIAVLRCQPGLTIVAPADNDQTHAAVLSTWNLPGPIYYRLGKDDQPPVPGLQGEFALGRAQVVRRGRDVLMIALGNAAALTSAAAARLAADGVSATVAVVASVAPPPAHDLVQLLRTHPVAFTIETHSATGGLGTLAAELIADGGIACPLVRCGITPRLDGITGSTRFMMEREGLSAAGIAARVLDVLGRSALGEPRAGVVGRASPIV